MENNVIDDFMDNVEQVARQIREYTEHEYVDIIKNCDFLVGSIEIAHKLVEVLLEGVTVICSPHICSSSTIFAIKKFDCDILD